MTDLQWLIGGEAGYGIMTTGTMMAKIFTRLGLSVFDYVEYPSLIRGGHNAYYVRGSDEEIFSQKKTVDILVALNKDTIEKHRDELTPNAAIIYDPNVVKLDGIDLPKTLLLVPVPLLEITKQVGADRLMVNTVAVGVSLGLFHKDYAVLQKIIDGAFGKKGDAVVAENVKTSKAGFDYVVKNFAGKFGITVTPKPQTSLLIGGAEAVALGAIRAGVQFAAIYPMTPINGVLAYLVAQALSYHIVVKEPEDEIAGINMAIGASFTGARSMVATSGGGFSLMIEAMGLAAQSETPLVVVMGMRPGPATGMPTWTEQGDLQFMLHHAQGDFPRIVVAPGDITEAFEQTMHAFNLAEKYQLQVIVLVDKYLMEGHTSISTEEFQISNDKFQIERGKILTDEQTLQETDYKRYALVDDGISPRSLPGQKNGIALNGSDEHDEKGLYNETEEIRIAMMDKRYKKFDQAVSEIPQPVLVGNPDASLTVISFGSTKMPVLEAMKWLKKDGINVNLLNISYVYPFPAETIANVIKNAKKTIVIEGNKTGQLESLIREHTGLQPTHNFRKYSGRPFYPEEIVAKIKSIL